MGAIATEPTMGQCSDLLPKLRCFVVNVCKCLQIYHPLACLPYVKVASHKCVVAKWRYQQRKCELITDNQNGNQSTPMSCDSTFEVEIQRE